MIGTLLTRIKGRGATPARAYLLLCSAALILALCLVGCSSAGPSSTAQSQAAASASAASAATAESSAASADASADSVSSGLSASTDASTASSGATASSDDFDRAVVGSWRVNSFEYGNNRKTKIDSDSISLLRKLGFYETMTFFHDGTYQIDHGRGNIVKSTWEETGYNTLLLHDVLDETDSGASDAEATISSGRMTIEYDSKEYHHVKLVYSKQ